MSRADLAPFWADLRALALPELAAALDLSPSHRRWGPCPACGSETASGTDRRPPLGLSAHGWVCCRPGCPSADAPRNAAALMGWSLLGRPPARTAADWGALHAWMWSHSLTSTPPLDTGAPIPAQRPRKPAPPQAPPAPLPPWWEVERLWEESREIEPDTPEGVWLDGAIPHPGDPDTPLGTILYHSARALPGPLLPRWASYQPTGERRRDWYSLGYRVVLPLYDADGRIASLKVRSILADRPRSYPKELPPSGKRLRGLVFADRLALDLWLPGEPCPKIAWVAEGGTDFLSLAARNAWRHVVEGRDPEATLGTFSGGWDARLPAQLRADLRVIVATDDDPAGHRYAATIAATLGPDQRLTRWSPPAPGLDVRGALAGGAA